MKKILLLVTAISTSVLAQNPSFMVGPEREMTSMNNPEANAFTFKDNHYVLFRKYVSPDGMTFHLDGFTGATDQPLCAANFQVPQAPNEIAIYEGFTVQSDKMLLFRSVYNKAEKRTALFAHEVSDKGVVNSSGKEVASISSEKLMNAGNFTIEASADGKYFVILEEQPFLKESKEKIGVSVYDNALNKTWHKDYEFPYDCRKGPENSAVVTNSGLVYLLKKIVIPKTPEAYSVFVFSGNGANVKETSLKLEDPKKIVNYSTAVNQSNGDLTIAGYYTEDGKVSVSIGGVNFKGQFYFRLNGTNGDIAASGTNPFEKIMNSLRVLNVRLLDHSTYLFGESQYEANLSTNRADAHGFPAYDREYHADAMYITVFDESGKASSNTILPKDNKSVEDGGFGNGYATGVSGGKVFIVYNDFQYKHDGLEHKIVGPALANLKVPVIQPLSAAGKPEKEIPMIGYSVGGKEGIAALYPSIYQQVGDKEMFFLGRKGTAVYPIRLKLP
jgi:hypothetical protein